MGERGSVLRGRRSERELLDGVLADIKSGRSRVLVLRGEAGAGKTALLEYLDRRSGRVVRTAGVEPEAEIAYSALQQLCAPFLDRIDRLPDPQRRALATAFGLEPGDPPEGLIVGLAVLGLLTEASADEPLICLVDDVQWLDRMSQVILTFVARRLGAEPVAIVFAARSPGDEQLLEGLPELQVRGLPPDEARALLDSVLRGPIDERVRDRIVADTRGNPLALLELPRGLSPTELAFGFGAQSATPLTGRVEQGFRQRIEALPEDTRRSLLTAAVEPVGDVSLLRRALDELGIGPEALVPAEDAGLVEVGTRVRFRHPLVRSASWRSATAPALRAAHAALAAVTDPDQEPDRRAWHRAHAAVGTDEVIAAELASSADRAMARGGRVAAAAFLERAAQLTLDPQTRAARTLAAAWAAFGAGDIARVSELLGAVELGHLDPLQQAGVGRLRAQLVFATDQGARSVEPLLAAARALEPLDLAAARDTALSAVTAAVYMGRPSDAAGHSADLDDTVHCRAIPGAVPDAPLLDGAVLEAAAVLADPADLPGRLLGGLARWGRSGRRAAVAPLRAVLYEATHEHAHLLRLLDPVAAELWDASIRDRMTEHAVAEARAVGALALLPVALLARADVLLLHGRLAEAAEVIAEADSLGAGPHSLVRLGPAMALAALRGDETAADSLADDATTQAGARGENRLLSLAAYARALLGNGLGRYPAALAAAAEATGRADLGVTGPLLSELVEAAARTGDLPAADGARARLAEWTREAGTPWALGTQATADALAGPHAEAEARYVEAVARFTESRLDLPLARAELLLGEWLRRENRRADARRHLRTAHEMFSTMGADGFRARAARELAATGETVRKREVGRPTELTPQEAQIARLAVQGSTNPEIGAALYLSPRTVEWHLRKVFAKFGITSRRELAGALRPH